MRIIRTVMLGNSLRQHLSIPSRPTAVIRSISLIACLRSTPLSTRSWTRRNRTKYECNGILQRSISSSERGYLRATATWMGLVSPACEVWLFRDSRVDKTRYPPAQVSTRMHATKQNPNYPYFTAVSFIARHTYNIVQAHRYSWLSCIALKQAGLAARACTMRLQYQ